MAVISVKELFETRRGGDNLQRKREYVRYFEVVTDDVTDDAYTAGAGNAGGVQVPRNGEPHPSDVYAVMVDIDASQSSESPYIWYVSCRYSSDFAPDQQRESIEYDSFGNPSETAGATTGSGGGQVTREPDPRNRPAQWRIAGEQVVEVVTDERGGDGEAVVNSAGDPFDPPLTEERSYPVFTVVKNVALTNPILEWQTQEEYRDSVNLGTYRGREEGTLRVTQLDFEGAVENDIAYAVVTLSVKYRPDGWQKRVLDRGFNEKYGPTADFPNGYRQRIRDVKTGAFATEPTLLDGSGRRLDPDADPVYLTFDTRLYKDFSVLFGYLGL